MLQAYDNSLISAVDKIWKVELDYYARYESANRTEGCLYTYTIHYPKQANPEKF